MELISINIGRAQPLSIAGERVLSGIDKRPADGPVHIGRQGLKGDKICDTRNHGGPDQAVYVYGMGDYTWWAEQLGREMVPGLFGENLTVSGLESAGVKVGDRLQVGEVVLEVTAPRIPCAKFASRMGDLGWVKTFSKAGRPGLYCRVIQEGYVNAGDTVRLKPYAGESVSILEEFRLFYEKRPDEAALRRLLAAPVAERSRRYFEDKLKALS